MDGSAVASSAGIGYGDLRPQAAARNPFPIYRDLAGILVRTPAEAQPDERIARVLGTCAGYAYADSATMATMMTRLGLPRNRCVQVSQVVDAMFICSNAFVVQSENNKVVILCYRGTEPTNAVNWLTDLTVEPTAIRIPGTRELRHAKREMVVHGDFYRNLRATHWQVSAVLRRAVAGLPIDGGDDAAGAAKKLGPLKALYITGHSLGGAITVLMAVLIHIDPDYADLRPLLAGVYTYGQPMVGNSALAEACDDKGISARVHRYVYRNDLVPQLPPKQTPDFRHFGDEQRFDGKAWAESPPSKQMSLTGLLDILPDFVAHQIPRLPLPRLRHSLLDHGPEYYIQALTKPGDPTEFGDATLGAVAH